MAGDAEDFPYRQYVDDTWNAHDADAFERYYAPDAIVHSRTPEIEPGVGIQHLKKLARALFIAFPDMRVTIDEAIAKGDKLAVRLTLEGTHLGEFVGLAPTGKRIHVIDLAMYHVDEGLITEVWSMLDMAEMRKQFATP